MYGFLYIKNGDVSSVKKKCRDLLSAKKIAQCEQNKKKTEKEKKLFIQWTQQIDNVSCKNIENHHRPMIWHFN